MVLVELNTLLMPSKTNRAKSYSVKSFGAFNVNKVTESTHVTLSARLPLPVPSMLSWLIVPPILISQSSTQHGRSLRVSSLETDAPFCASWRLSMPFTELSDTWQVTRSLPPSLRPSLRQNNCLPRVSSLISVVYAANNHLTILLSNMGGIRVA